MTIISIYLGIACKYHGISKNNMVHVAVIAFGTLSDFVC